MPLKQCPAKQWDLGSCLLADRQDRTPQPLGSLLPKLRSSQLQVPAGNGVWLPSCSPVDLPGWVRSSGCCSIVVRVVVSPPLCAAELLFSPGAGREAEMLGEELVEVGRD